MPIGRIPQCRKRGPVCLCTALYRQRLIDKVEKARTRKPGDPNPFVNPKEFQEFMASRIVDTDKRIAAVKAEAATAGQ